MDGRNPKPPRAEINSDHSTEKIREELSQRWRVRVDNFLMAHSAAHLYHHLVDELPWRTFVVSDGRLLGTPAGVAISAEEDRQIVEHAQIGTRKGFASVYDADYVAAEDSASAVAGFENPEAPEKSLLDGAMNTSSLRGFIGELLGLHGALQIHTQVLRLRPGHFVTFHSALRTPRRRYQRAEFFLHLTPVWRPEWGGILEFRNPDGRTIEGFAPSFNSLDVFTYPQGHWISPVSAFAQGARLGIVGEIHVLPPGA